MNCDALAAQAKALFVETWVATYSQWPGATVDPVTICEIFDGLPFTEDTVVVTHDSRDRLLGFAQVSADWTELCRLYVRPDAQHNRLGSTILGIVLELATDRGIGDLTLWTDEINTRARQFYLANGAVATGSRRQARENEGCLVQVEYAFSL